MSDYLDLTRSVPASADPVVSTTLVGQFRQLDLLYRGLPSQPAFRAYARACSGRCSRESDGMHAPVRVATPSSCAPGSSGRWWNSAIRQRVAETRARFEKYLAKPASFVPTSAAACSATWRRRPTRRSGSACTRWQRPRSPSSNARSSTACWARRRATRSTQKSLALVFSDEIAPTIGPIIVSSAGRAASGNGAGFRHHQLGQVLQAAGSQLGAAIRAETGEQQLRPEVRRQAQCLRRGQGSGERPPGIHPGDRADPLRGEGARYASA